MEIALQAISDSVSKPIHEITLEQELYNDLRLDSRRFLKLIRLIENALDVEIDDDDIFDVDLICVKDIVSFIEKIAKDKTIAIVQ